MKNLKGVIAKTTEISQVIGKEGIAHYRGYLVQDLAKNVSFEETIHLLLYGRLPNQQELQLVKSKLGQARGIPKEVEDFILKYASSAHPMDVLRTCTSLLGVLDQSTPENQEELIDNILSLHAKISTIVGYIYTARKYGEVKEVRSDLSEGEYFMYLLEGEKATAEEAKVMDVIFTLHAEHGLNASTFSGLVTISSLSDIYSATTSSIGTLKGSLHGGANERVLRMLLEIGGLDKVEPWVRNKLSKKEKIMGIGHPVYKTIDPRSIVLKDMAIKLTESRGKQEMVKMCDLIAEIMLEKNLYPNVDFYAAIVYHALDIPIDLFTPIFAVSRSIGWGAHVAEQLANNSIIRPSSAYDGVPYPRNIVPIESRS